MLGTPGPGNPEQATPGEPPRRPIRSFVLRQGRLTPAQARRWITEQVYLQRKTDQWEPWAVAQASTHDWRMVLEAGRALGNFSSLEWLGGVDVPTSIIVTVRDEVIPIRRQIQLVTSIPHAQIHRIAAGHDAAVAAADQFVPALVRSIDAIVDRGRSTAAMS